MRMYKAYPFLLRGAEDAHNTGEGATMKSNEEPSKVFAHRDTPFGGWIFTIRRAESDDLRFPYVSTEDAAELMVIATNRDLPISVGARRLIRRLAGVGGP